MWCAMATVVLNFGLNPFAQDDHYQVQEPIRIGDSRNAVNSYRGGSDQQTSYFAQTDSGTGAVDEPPLDQSISYSSSSSADDPYADTSAYVGTQFSIYA
jgi:hypothetical protein